MIDKFLKATGLRTQKEFLQRYPTEDSFFNEYPEYMPYRLGGKVNHMQYGGYQTQTRRQGNIVITEDTPMDTFVEKTPPIDPYNQMTPLMNPYAGAFYQPQLPVNYQPYKSVQYEGVVTPNYWKKKQYDPQTDTWIDMGHQDLVEMQPQYTGDWNNPQRAAFESTMPDSIGPYKTRRGRRSRRFGNRVINYDEYKYGGQYQEGGEYDLTPEEIDSLKKLGYDFETL